MRNALTPVLLFVFAAVLPAAKNLEVYFIDVEGGQATLFVSPSGECMLVDTGWPDWNNRDAVGAPRDHNPSDPFIANVDEICQAKWLRVEALKDGSFTVSNSRNRYQKTYAKR